MKRTLFVALLLAVGTTAFAQRQKVSVGKDGEMIRAAKWEELQLCRL